MNDIEARARLRAHVNDALTAAQQAQSPQEIIALCLTGALAAAREFLDAAIAEEEAQ